MKEIDDPLTRVLAGLKARVRPGESAPASESGCARCGDHPGYAGTRWEGRGPQARQVPVLCDCAVGQALGRARLGGLLKNAHLYSRSDATFESFRPTPEQYPAYLAAQSFAQRDRGWLVLLGPLGSGKTHLATAAARAYALRTTGSAYVATAQELVEAAHAHVRDRESADALAQLVDVGLLVVDDLGADQTGRFAEGRLAALLEARYSARRLTVITSNMPLGAFGDRLASRLLDTDTTTVAVIPLRIDLRANRASIPPVAHNDYTFPLSAQRSALHLRAHDVSSDQVICHVCNVRPDLRRCPRAHPEPVGDSCVFCGVVGGHLPLCPGDHD